MTYIKYITIFSTTFFKLYHRKDLYHFCAQVYFIDKINISSMIAMVYIKYTIKTLEYNKIITIINNIV